MKLKETLETTMKLLKKHQLDCDTVDPEHRLRTVRRSDSEGIEGAGSYVSGHINVKLQFSLKLLVLQHYKIIKLKEDEYGFIS